MIGQFPSFVGFHANFTEFVVISETSGGEGGSGTSRDVRDKQLISELKTCIQHYKQY